MQSKPLICPWRQNKETTSLIQNYFYLPLSSAYGVLCVLQGRVLSAVEITITLAQPYKWVPFVFAGRAGGARLGSHVDGS